jgi:tRNA(Ile)-lysidine synthase
MCRLSLDKILSDGRNPVVRTRKQGDYIVPLGMQGRKKLQDFFVDQKYAREERDRIPILCLGSEVVWVAGGRISENYKVDDGTERIIVLEYSAKM